MKYNVIQTTIGQVYLNVYVFANGRKLLSGHNVTDAIHEDYKTLPDFPIDLGDGFIPVVNPVTIENTVIYWLTMAASGNVVAASLLVALVKETLDRRVDRVFGKELSESEYKRNSTSSMSEMICSFLTDDPN